jgi:hypothetical protein
MFPFDVVVREFDCACAKHFAAGADGMAHMPRGRRALANDDRVYLGIRT